MATGGRTFNVTMNFYYQPSIESGCLLLVSSFLRNSLSMVSNIYDDSRTFGAELSLTLIMLQSSDDKHGCSEKKN